ncbi:MAG TPA: ATP synthase F1 subunit gamma [Acidimicrobiales bacterium]|jgi:F-type H+-transporting ATPase subunit gamma|nr:ATP synthase F1 subunit gamma [Acidimicrobiales bacterium]
MAGGQERVLRRRIRSVQSTKKITKAMELIAASQIVRSLNRMTANRAYRAGMARLVVEAAKGDPAAAAKLLGTPEERHNVVVLAIVADRGLSGPYNTSVLRATERLLTELTSEGIGIRLLTVGKKAQSYFRFRGQEVERSFLGVSERPTFSEAREVAAAVATPFVAGEVDQVLLVSTRYLSAGSQVAQVRQLLPLPDPTAAETAGEAGGVGGDRADTAPEGGGGYTEFEPDVETLLAELGPKAVESEIFTALLEGAASFFTAQQRAMAAASENADELIRTLSRIMNRARQDAITTEIMEIVGGAEALRQSKGA